MEYLQYLPAAFIFTFAAVVMLRWHQDEAN